MQAGTVRILLLIGIVSASTLIFPGFVLADSGTSQFGQCVTLNFTFYGSVNADESELVEYADGFANDLYFCWLNQSIALIFRYILYIVLLIQSSIIWFINQANALVIWFNATLLVILNFMAGTVNNAAQQIVESIDFSGAHVTTVVEPGSSNIWDVLISLVGGIQGVVNSLTTAISTITGQLASIINTAINGLVSIILGIFDVVVALINAIANIIIILIEIVGLVIITLLDLIGIGIQVVGGVVLALVIGVISGFSAPTVDPISQIGAVTGANVGSLSACTGLAFHLCIGEYVLDNTILGAGSPLSPAMFILIGAVWLDRLMWAINKIRSVAK